MTKRRRSAWRSSIAATILAVLLGIAAWSICGSAFAADQWGWFLAEATVDEWFLLQGKATVTVAGGHFKAELYNDKGFRVATLEGEERSGVLDVKVERHGTDDDIRSMRGQQRTTEFRAERKRRESILFSEPGRIPAVVIGLTHDTAIR